MGGMRPMLAMVRGYTLHAALAAPCCVLALPGLAWAQGAPARPAAAADDARMREAMIAASIASYPGNCPCPYSTMRNGRSCGTRSAYSKPGGAAPLCYPRDISEAMLAQTRRQGR